MPANNANSLNFGLKFILQINDELGVQFMPQIIMPQIIEFKELQDPASKNGQII